MNKYSSGYMLCSLLSIFGALVLVVCTLCSFFFFFVYLKTDLQGGAPIIGIGATIMIFGFLQGITSLGVGAVGRAILDGSIAQQEIAKKIVAGAIGTTTSNFPLNPRNNSAEEQSIAPASPNSPFVRTDLKIFKSAGDMQAFKEEVYEGVSIKYYYQRGEYVVDGYSFYSSGDAKNYIMSRRASV